MTAQQCLAHPWLCTSSAQDIPSRCVASGGAACVSVNTTPVGSPLGCRRALDPSPDGGAESEPLKRYRCDAEENVEISDSRCGGSLQQDVETYIDSSRNCEELHVTLASKTKVCELSSVSTSVILSSSASTPEKMSSTMTLQVTPPTMKSSLTVKASKMLVALGDCSPQLSRKDGVEETNESQSGMTEVGHA